ncbi:MAG: helicase, partial [Spartobacteria bacterium]|nr:helicase [Spartobacteria bacterium]
RMFPVETEYLSRPVDFRKKSVWEVAADAFERWVKSGGAGDALVFMPGAYEIRKTVEEIRHRSAAKAFAVLPLHGDMPAEEQDAAVARSGGRKVVVATNVAETSITIEGIQAVIDSGLARVARYDPHRGINTLLIEKISCASADQRQGRAGRLAPGRCLRLWTEQEHRQRPLQDIPEIKRVDLAETILTLKAIGVADIGMFPWVEPPEEKSLQRSEALLRDLGAIEMTGALTCLGRRMASFPVHPRYSRMLLAGEEYGCVREMALISALMQSRDILIRNVGKHEKEQRRLQLGEEVASDFLHLMRAWSFADCNRYDLGKCRELGIHAGAARQVTPVFAHFLRIAEKEGLSINPYPPDDRALQKCILLGFSDQLARRRDQGTLRCELIHGRSGELARESAVRASPLIVASEIREIQRGGDRSLSVLLTQATAVEEAWLEELFPGESMESRCVMYDPVLKRVVGARERRFRDLALECRTGEEVGDDDAARILAEEILRGRLALPHWDDAVEQWIARVNCLAAWCPEWDLPPITDEARATILEQICHGLRSAKDLKQAPVWPVVRSWLSPDRQALLDRYAPERITLPSGRKTKVRYVAGNAPVISATIQSLYDLHESPRVADGRIAICVEILAPNQRPVQITEDMVSFWREHYPRVKKELQRKYYKHEWR